MKKICWFKVYLHERAISLSLLACGNKSRRKPSQWLFGTLEKVETRVFDGKLFYKRMNELGHSQADPMFCSCNRRNK